MNRLLTLQEVAAQVGLALLVGGSGVAKLFGDFPGAAERPGTRQRRAAASGELRL